MLIYFRLETSVSPALQERPSAMDRDSSSTSSNETSVPGRRDRHRGRRHGRPSAVDRDDRSTTSDESSVPGRRERGRERGRERAPGIPSAMDRDDSDPNMIYSGSSDSDPTPDVYSKAVDKAVSTSHTIKSFYGSKHKDSASISTSVTKPKDLRPRKKQPPKVQESSSSEQDDSDLDKDYEPPKDSPKKTVSAPKGKGCGKRPRSPQKTSEAKRPRGRPRGAGKAFRSSSSLFGDEASVPGRAPARRGRAGRAPGRGMLRGRLLKQKTASPGSVLQGNYYYYYYGNIIDYYTKSCYINFILYCKFFNLVQNTRTAN